MTSPASISALRRVRDRASRRSAAVWPRKRSSRSPAPAASTSKTLRPGGRNERRPPALRRTRPRAHALAPCALLRLGVHARSRRRVRPPGSAAAGATSGPSAATMVSTVGRGPGLMGVEPAPHRRDMGRACCRSSRRRCARRNRPRDRRKLPSAPACRNSGSPRHASAARRRWPWRSASRPGRPRSWRGWRPGDRRRRRRNWRR